MHKTVSVLLLSSVLVLAVNAHHITTKVSGAVPAMADDTMPVPTSASIHQLVNIHPKNNGTTAGSTVQFWTTQGNQGIDASTDYLGTRDNAWLCIRTAKILANSSQIDTRWMSVDGLNYRLSVGDSLPTLPIRMPHASLIQGDPADRHTMWSCENPSIDNGGGDTLLAVGGYINNNGDGKRSLYITPEKFYIQIADEGDSNGRSVQYRFTKNGIYFKSFDGEQQRADYNLTNQNGPAGSVMTMNAASDSAVWQPIDIQALMQSLPEYANDVAAAAGGVPLGGAYVEAATSYIKRRKH